MVIACLGIFLLYNNCGKVDITQTPKVIESIRGGSTDTGNPKFQLKAENVNSITSSLQNIFLGCGANSNNAARLVEAFKASVQTARPILKLNPGSATDNINAVSANIQKFWRTGEVNESEAFSCLERLTPFGCDMLEGSAQMGFTFNEQRANNLFRLIQCVNLIEEKAP